MSKDGGPAFPTLGDEFMQCGDGVWRPKSEYGIQGDPGMSLRDYFAAKAMQGHCGNSRLGSFTSASRDEDLLRAAELYYRMADAMLKARKQ